MSKLNIRNQQLYSQSTQSKKQMEEQIIHLKKSHAQTEQNTDKYSQLADFTIFLIKLIQRLEVQSHTNVSENPMLKQIVNEAKYINGRKMHLDISLPDSPESMLDQMCKTNVEGKENSIIDEYYMPKILSMAKFHVEAINQLHKSCFSS